MLPDVLDGQTCWVVGQMVPDSTGSFEGRSWLFQGCFTTEDRAVQACHGPTYFIGPAIMDEDLPAEVIDWPGSRYPWDDMPDEDAQ